MRFKDEKNSMFSLHDTPLHKKEVLLSALNEFPEVLEIPVFPGIVYISKKENGAQKGQIYKSLIFRI